MLSKRLREVRKEKKLTQQELAEKAGLHLTYVGHLELGKYHPTIVILVCLNSFRLAVIDNRLNC